MPETRPSEQDFLSDLPSSSFELTEASLSDEKESAEGEVDDRREPKVTTMLSVIGPHHSGKSLAWRGWGDGSTKRQAALPGSDENRKGGRSVTLACPFFSLFLSRLAFEAEGGAQRGRFAFLATRFDLSSEDCCQLRPWIKSSRAVSLLLLVQSASLFLPLFLLCG